MTQDPVCGMEVGESASPVTAVLGDRTFFFCSAGCAAAFRLAPGEYAALADLLPPALARLHDLARNLWWSWHPEAQGLFRALAPQTHELVNDPLRVLAGLDRAAVEARAADAEFMRLYARVIAAFDADLARPSRPAAVAGQSPGLVAYFSAEFGVHGSLPLYSGGLGVLAGDIAKEASDLGLPMVGVGFMYPQGYFRQRLTPDGRQEETYERLDRALAPTEPACAVSAQPCVLALTLPDTTIQVSVWAVRVGRVRLHLMDTDVEANAPADREISGRLYAGNQEFRLRQEIVLGIGGVRLLRALGVVPTVWHANEGHSAFMMLERLRELVADGTPLAEARERVKASTVFTTHTPVAAGHDTFPFELIDKYFASYWAGLDLDRERFLALGAHDDGEGPRFNMTALALRLSGRRTAVSRRHGEVSRRMWRSLWPASSEGDVPIVAVTNGVHVPSWIAPELDRLYQSYLAQDWLAQQDDPQLWAGIRAMPDRELWRAHLESKRRLMRFLRERARERLSHGRSQPGAALASGVLLDPEVLTVGFARRFAMYKRAALVFRDPARLRSILTHPRRPVQLVFAGKAHPADEPAKQVLRSVYQACLEAGYAGRIAFVEDYDMELARHLVQGVDVWLNTPRPPMEASGTSGQKAAINGVPNLSVLDGWWAEAFDGANGWAIDAGTGGLDPEAQDAADAERLYGLLEADVAPLYYDDRGPDGVPAAWVRLMQRVIETITPRFTARRLLKAYVAQLYVPAVPGA